VSCISAVNEDIKANVACGRWEQTSRRDVALYLFFYGSGIQPSILAQQALRFSMWYIRFTTGKARREIESFCVLSGK
jgi:hypothetical protein